MVFNHLIDTYLPHVAPYDSFAIFGPTVQEFTPPVLLECAHPLQGRDRLSERPIEGMGRLPIGLTGGKFRTRLKTDHKHTAEDVRTGKTVSCMVVQVGFHSPRASQRVEAGVRKRCWRAVMQQTVFTCMKLNRSSVREGLRFWTDLPVAGNYPYPERTPTRKRGVERATAAFVTQCTVYAAGDDACTWVCRGVHPG